MSHSKSMLTIHIHQYQNTMFISYTYMYVMYTNMTVKYFDFNFLIDLCLKTVERFINHKDKCNFDLSTAMDILQDGIYLM